MPSFPILDLVIGLIFIYFLLSIICSSAVEIVLTIANARAKILSEWLNTIFNQKSLNSLGQPTDETLGNAIMNHSALTALSKKNESTTFIKAENFVIALLDKITIVPATDETPKMQLPPSTLNDHIAAISNTSVISPELKRTFLSFATEAQQIVAAAGTTNTKSDLNLFKLKLEKWYDSNNDRLSGSIKKRWAMGWTALFAMIIAIALNVDSIAITKYLYANKEARETIVKNAYKAIEDTAVINHFERMKINNTDSDAVNYIKHNIKTIKSAYATVNTSIPLGWKDNELNSKEAWLNKIVGLIITILAIQLGAPFWFDLLNKFTNLRGAGPKPASTTDPAKTEKEKQNV